MFGFDIIDAALLPAMLVALVAGVLSFLSPCVLPIVPPYLAYMGGISMGEMTAGRQRRRVILPALFFVLGLSTVFMLLGIYALGLGLPFLLAAIFVERSMGLMTRLKRHMKLIERAMGVLLLIVGLALLTGAFTDFSYWMLELYGAMGIPVPG